MLLYLYYYQILDINYFHRRGVAQLVEHGSPKPGVAGSSPVSPAKLKHYENSVF